MDERAQAAMIADRLLDEPNADPDDDIRVLARQFERSQEQIRAMLWLIVNGEKCFGTLWRQATAADIRAAMRPDSAQCRETEGHT